MGKLVTAFIVGIIAFFELCLTGRAGYAWRLARGKGNYLSRAYVSLTSALIILAVVTVLSTVCFITMSQAGDQRIEPERTSMDKGMEPPACLIDRTAKAIVIGCLIFSCLVWFYVSFKNQKKSNRKS